MNNSRNIAVEKALEFIKKNRKTFYREWYKKWGNRCIMISDNMFKADFKHNPELYAEAEMIKDSLMVMGFFKEWTHGFGFKDAIEVRKVHIDKFLKLRLFPMVKKNRGIFPHEDKTKAILEFIVRGFIHEDDAHLDKENRCWVKCNIAPLVWPKDFELHQEAIDIQKRMGIPGYTGTITALKNK